jgi:hypothetical protein
MAFGDSHEKAREGTKRESNKAGILLWSKLSFFVTFVPLCGN